MQLFSESVSRIGWDPLSFQSWHVKVPDKDLNSYTCKRQQNNIHHVLNEILY